MKIGILTYHRSHNYGALLQAVATRVTLQKMGHEVYYIDYFPPYHQRMYKLFSLKAFMKEGLRGKMFYLYHTIKEYPYRKKRYDNFNDFIKEEICPFCKKFDERYDLVIYGSDQIWRIQKESQDFNPLYFGNNKQLAKKHISYAASMGIEELSDEKKEKLKSLVKNLDAISVRELSLKRLLESLGISNVCQTIDPTFLLSADEWAKIVPNSNQNNNQYVLLYDLLIGSFNHDAVRKFASDRGLELVELSGAAYKGDTKYFRSTDGPCQFLQLIRNAQYVFTSSFHGLAFSLIFNKQFYVSFKKNPGRAFSLLEKMGLTDRIISPQATIIPESKTIGYSYVNEVLELEKKKSISFLNENCSL